MQIGFMVEKNLRWKYIYIYIYLLYIFKYMYINFYMIVL